MILEKNKKTTTPLLNTISFDNGLINSNFVYPLFKENLMRNLFKLITIVIAVFSFSNMQASHLLGGEITWECSGQDYIFTLKLYKDCGTSSGGTGSLGASQNISISGGGHNINSMNAPLVQTVDLTPTCNNYQTNKLTCPGSPSSTGALLMFVYKTGPINLSGVIPPGGWTFSWSSCCRPAGLAYAANGSYYLRAKMYPFSGNGNARPCYDYSPIFASSPGIVLCAGYPFAYNHNATDKEIDSLAYKWAAPWSANNTSIPYIAPYTVNNQMPGNPQLDVNTGEIYTNNLNTPGSFPTCVMVEAWKCGEKVAEIFRDLPVIFSQNCGKLNDGVTDNTSPDLTINNVPVAPFGGYRDTLLAGSNVCFRMQSLDIEFNPNPPAGTGQMNTLIPLGSQFGVPINNPLAGCNIPPCATLKHPTTGAAPLLTNQFGVEAEFCWQTTCDHIGKANGCISASSTYNFILKVTDDFCPVPGINYLTASITVVNKPKLDPPTIRCADVLPNGDVSLSWDSTSDSLTSFYSYEIYYSANINGPYTLIDSVMNSQTINYIDNNPARNVYTNGTGYYYMLTRSACHGAYYSPTTDTISPMDLTLVVGGGGGIAQLSWNALTTPLLPSTTGYYYIWREAPIGTWTLVDSTMGLTYNDQVTVCWDTLSYKIQVKDDLPCASNSTIRGNWFGANTPPNAPLIDSVTVVNNNTNLIAWSPSTTTSVDTYFVYQFIPPATYNLVGTVGLPAPFSFTHTPVTPGTQSYNYVVTPMDSCDIVGDTSLVHNTIWARLDSTDHCRAENYIYWNKYINWAAGVQRYEIWANENAAGYNLVGTLSGPSLDTAFVHTGINNSNYCYIIRAFDGNGRSSSSNELCFAVNNLLDSSIVQAPSLRCISVEPNQQDITITWVAPLDPTGNFASYEVFHATNVGGPYSSIAVINNAATLTYTHIGAFSANSNNYYYVTTNSGCYGTDPSRSTSDTLTPIKLNVTQPTAVTANLTWNQIINPNIPTSSGNYDVYRETPFTSTNWNVLGNTPYGNENYNDARNVCNELVGYRIEIGDQSGCISVSSIDTARFRDTIPPQVISPDSISIDPFTGNVIIGWTPGPDADVTGYNIIKFNPSTGAHVNVGNVPTPGTNYTYIGANANNEAEQYRVTVYDSCGNEITYVLNYHKTIYLESDIDICLPGVYLNWNAYEGWTTSISYNIYFSENGGPFTYLATTNNLNYLHTPINNGSNYRYIVRAFDDGGAGPRSSTSNMVMEDAALFATPDYHYLQYVTVSDTNEIEISAYVDTAAQISQFNLMRSDFKTGPYSLITSESMGTDTIIKFRDDNVTTSYKSYFYRVEAVDPCGKIVETSNNGRSILLKVQDDEAEATNTLTWNKYEDWAGTVKEYHIYKGVNGANNMQLMAKFKGDTAQTALIDYLAPELDGIGKFCYQIVAIEDNPSFATLEPSVSVSNVVCVTHEPYFYIPNSFVINNNAGILDFRPSLRFSDLEGYNFSIWDRWGHQIFETNNLAEGWNGKFNNTGEFVQTGVYVYLVKFRTANGKDIEKRGTVTILK